MSLRRIGIAALVTLFPIGAFAEGAPASSATPAPVTTDMVMPLPLAAAPAAKAEPALPPPPAPAASAIAAATGSKPAAPVPSETETRALATSSATADVAAQAAITKQSPIPDGALEVTATGTLEWLRQDDMYVARGNAVARHNDTTLKGSVLVAHYQIPAGKKSGSEITQVTAEGDPVELISPTAVAYGQHGVYDMPKHLVLLLGNNLKLVTTDEVVTARDSLEYYEDLDTGVARGDAVMLRGADKLTADVIAAKFVHKDHPDQKGGDQKNDAKPVQPAPQPATADADGDKPKANSLERLDAKGHVVLVTETDVVTGDEGVYNPITDQATVLGNVHVTRDQNQLDGNRAEVDMSTGISRVFAAPNAKVHGLFVPKKKDKAATSDQASADEGGQ